MFILRYAYEMHLCIVHDIIYGSAYNIAHVIPYHLGGEDYLRFDSTDTRMMINKIRYTGNKLFASTRNKLTRTLKVSLMPSLHLAYDELTAFLRCINSHFVTKSYGFGAS